MTLRFLVGVAAALSVFTGWGAAYAANHALARASAVCHEDQRCWNWRTMGNQRRAIVTIGGRTLVVTPARFDRANAGFWIDWQRTPRLKGDGVRFDVQHY